MEDFITRLEAQTITGLSKPTILAAIYRGDLPAQRVGGRWLIRRVDAEAFAAAHTGWGGQPRRLPETVEVTG